MSIDIHDRYVLEPDDPDLQRRAAQYIVDHCNDEKAALEVLAMLFAPVRS